VVITHWARQPGAQVFTFGQAVAVAAANLSQRDRLAVEGPPADAAVAVRAALDEVGPSFRPIGQETLIRELVATQPELELVDVFGWMWTDRPTTGGVRRNRRGRDES
jgi:hypothetical protein